MSRLSSGRSIFVISLLACSARCCSSNISAAFAANCARSKNSSASRSGFVFLSAASRAAISSGANGLGSTPGGSGFIFCAASSSCTHPPLPCLAHSNCLLAARINVKASGSKTITISIITQRTARSRIFWSGLSPYIRAAIYLIGPTSASTFLASAANGARSACNCCIIF